MRLGLATNGFNTFGNLSLAYSMWPMVLTIYNLPPWLCLKESFFILTLLIPGFQAPSKDIDVFLRPLADELKQFWPQGVKTQDAVDNNNFNMHVVLIWITDDFPVHSSLSSWSGCGDKVCPTYNKDTPSMRVISKTAYVGHRRFCQYQMHGETTGNSMGKEGENLHLSDSLM